MKAKKPKRPESDAERAAAARSVARKMLDEPLPSWGREQRVSVFREASGRILITRGGRAFVRCVPDVTPEDFPTLEDFRRFIMTLIDLVEEQAMIASWTYPLAKADIELQHKRVDGSREGGKKSANPSRSSVEQQVRACLRRGEGPEAYATAWAEEHSYSVRQIRNIIAKIRAE